MLFLCACSLGNIGTPNRTLAQPTAKAIVLQARDVPLLQKCPQSDRWAGLMLTGQPEMLPTGFASWSDLKAAGATDGWLSLYADNVPECPLLLGSAPPKGRIVYTVAIRFRDKASAEASYGSASQAFPVAATFFARFVAAGGTLVKGAGTGFGPNSAVATIRAHGVPTYVVLWQVRNFENIVWGDNYSAAEAASAIDHMNSRIH